MGKHHDFLEKDGEEQNQPLIELLRKVYQPTQQDVDSMARIEERLFSGNVQSISIPKKTFSDQKTYDKVVGTMNSHVGTLKTFKSQQWRSVLVVIAAIFAITIIVSSLVLAKNLLYNPSLGALPKSVLPHTATQIRNIHMVNSTIGWITCDDGSVLRTIDGGLNWSDVTPAALLALKQTSNEGSLFPDSSTAWIVIRTDPKYNGAQQSISTYSLVFHTSDAGQTWQESTLQKKVALGANTGRDYAITAITPDEAWILALRTLPGNEPVGVNSLYHTTNGGKTWVQAANIPQGVQNNNFPNISFANRQVGFMAALSNGLKSNNGIIYRTQNGGTSWESIAVPLPDPAQWQLTAISSLQFLTPNDGTFTAFFFRSTPQSGQGFSVFRTHDSGQTWTSSPIINVAKGPLPLDATFLDSQHGYVPLAGRPGFQQYYMTGDGGQHWKLTSMLLPYQNPHGDLVRSLHFTSSNTGWVLLASLNDHLIPIYQTYLYTTVDGGQTWTLVKAHFPAFTISRPAH